MVSSALLAHLILRNKLFVNEVFVNVWSKDHQISEEIFTLTLVTRAIPLSVE